MINLLPPKEKEELLLKRNQRLVIILGNTALIALACLALVLWAVQFYLLGQIPYHEVTVASVNSGQLSEDALQVKNSILAYNADLAAMDQFYKNPFRMTDSLKAMLGVPKPQGLHMTSIMLKRDKERNTAAVTISGVADSRDDLLAYKKNLETSQVVEDIYFPAESWVKPSTVDFYVTFTISQTPHEQ